jgi:hypothetical protein
MAENFHGSRKKIERAAKHISDLNKWITGGDFYTLSVNQDTERRNWLTLFFDAEALPAEDAAVMIGDALHNLRSALDILWHDIIIECGGRVSKYSRFPIRDTADELKAPLNNLLKEKQIEGEVHNFLLNDVKPYQTGNYNIWALDDLNIRDKHQLLIPVLKIMHITEVSFEDECGKEWPLNSFLVADQSWTLQLKEFFGKNLHMKNKGGAASTIFFSSDSPFKGTRVIPALDGIAKEVSRTVQAFDTLLFGKTG